MAQLDWNGKKEAYAAKHNPAPFAVSFGQKDNLLIRADNLDALASLENTHAEKVKMIYIDPPYNTGNTSNKRGWMYADQQATDEWLTFMLQRLMLAKRLLRSDGLVVFSIDDREYANLVQLADEVFDKENRLATIVWKTKSASNNATHLSVVHEYIVIYAKSLVSLKKADPRWRVPMEGAELVLAHAAELLADTKLSHEERSKKIKAWHKEQVLRIARELQKEDPNMLSRDAQKLATKRWGGLKNYKYFDDRGIYYAADIGAPGSGGGTYDVLHPITGKVCHLPTRGWSWSKETMQAKLAEHLVHFGIDETKQPLQKVFLYDTAQTVQTSLIEIPGRGASQELDGILGRRHSFPYPKPVSLLERLIRLMTHPGDIILDPFAGSGTTAHAVLRINFEDRLLHPANDERIWIAIQRDENYTDEEGKTYNVYDAITRERIQTVIQGYIPWNPRTGHSSEPVMGLGGKFVEVY